MDDEQINKMVDRFLTWSLPQDFNPDCGIAFNRTVNNKDRLDAGPGWWPTGTNLFTAEQAKEMIKHMLGM